MPKRKLFSQKDGSTFLEDAADIAEDVKAFFNHLPLELKRLLPIAEDIVRALQNLDDMLEEGEPVNEAIEKVLAMTKSEVDDKLYECIKDMLHSFVETLTILMNEIGSETGETKSLEASIALTDYSGVPALQADTAIQLAVYAVKS